jgi:hypothetical protein
VPAPYRLLGRGRVVAVADGESVGHVGEQERDLFGGQQAGVGEGDHAVAHGPDFSRPAGGQGGLGGVEPPGVDAAPDRVDEAGEDRPSGVVVQRKP